MRGIRNAAKRSEPHSQCLHCLETARSGGRVGLSAESATGKLRGHVELNWFDLPSSLRTGFLNPTESLLWLIAVSTGGPAANRPHPRHAVNNHGHALAHARAWAGLPSPRPSHHARTRAGRPWRPPRCRASPTCGTSGQRGTTRAMSTRRRIQNPRPDRQWWVSVVVDTSRVRVGPWHGMVEGDACEDFFPLPYQSR